MLSDGEDTSSLVSFDDVLALARKSGVCIYPIPLQSRTASADWRRPGSAGTSLGVGVFDAHACSGNRRPGVLPVADLRAQGHLRRSRRSCRASIRWLTRRSTAAPMDGSGGLSFGSPPVPSCGSARGRGIPPIRRAPASSASPSARAMSRARVSPRLLAALLTPTACSWAAAIVSRRWRAPRWRRPLVLLIADCIVRLSSARGSLVPSSRPAPGRVRTLHRTSACARRRRRRPGGRARVPVRTRRLLGVAAVPTAVTFVL